MPQESFLSLGGDQKTGRGLDRGMASLGAVALTHDPGRIGLPGMCGRPYLAPYCARTPLAWPAAAHHVTLCKVFPSGWRQEPGVV
jgi:hypothetical protein